MATNVEFAKLWNPGLAGIELFHARLLHHRFGKHMHEEYTIGMNERGQGCYVYRGELWRSHPGSFNLINPGELHTGQPHDQKGWGFRNIYVSVPFVERVLTQLEWQGGLPYFTEPAVWDQRLRTQFYQLFRLLNNSYSQPTSQLQRQSLLLDFFAQLMLNHTQPGSALRSPKPEHAAIALAREYLEAHYSEAVSIDVLAHLTGLSPYYLIRSFRQQVGLPPHSYQRHCQLMQAKRSLQTSKSLSEIALEHGFYDQSHLNRSFKQTFGVTPGDYQKHTR